VRDVPAFVWAALKATKDHVLPSGFFSNPVPKNLPTWRVCEPCQDRLDPAEERLRNLFVRGPSHAPEEHRDAFERAQRSARAVVPEKWDWVMNNQDIYEFAPVARPEQSDLDIVFSKMAGGLFYWKHGKLHPPPKIVVRGSLSPQLGSVYGPLPQGYSVVVVPLKWVGAKEMERILTPLAPENTIRVDEIRNLVILAGNQIAQYSLDTTMAPGELDHSFSEGSAPKVSVEFSSHLGGALQFTTEVSAPTLLVTEWLTGEVAFGE